MLSKLLGKFIRWDSWGNTLTGLGLSTRDKSASTLPQTEVLIDDETLDVVYHSDDLAERICSARWTEMLRQGFGMSIDDAEVSKSQEILGALDEMDVTAKATEAGIWGQLFGGSVILLGVDDGQEASEPLDEGRIKSFDWLQVVDRRFITAATYYEDATKPGYGTPETYSITPYTAMSAATEALVTVHETRLVRFPGTHTTVTRQLINGGWDYSVIQRVWSVLQQTATAWQSAMHLLSDASQAVFTIKGLMEKIAGGQKDDLQTRMELVEMSRSVLRAIVVDEGESFKREQTPFSGIPDMLDRAMQRTAAAARMPMTVLWGISPSGLNATGASDIALWYDQVKTEQNLVAKPRLRRIAYLKARAMGVTDDETAVHITFPSLYQLDPKESAELRKLQADTDAIYIDREVVSNSEIALSRFTADGWAEGTAIDIEAREAMKEAEVEALDHEKQEAADKELEDRIRGRSAPPAPEPEPEPEPAAESEPSPSTISTVAPEDAVDPKTALNGAQLMSLLEVVNRVATGMLPRATGVEIITASYPFTSAQAEQIMGAVGTPDFVPTAAPAGPGGPLGGPPQGPPKPPEEEGGEPPEGGEPAQEDEPGEPEGDDPEPPPFPPADEDEELEDEPEEG